MCQLSLVPTVFAGVAEAFGAHLNSKLTTDIVALQTKLDAEQQAGGGW
mgnify:CR=1 FL=1